jgi:restriction endonuclease S subunit
MPQTAAAYKRYLEKFDSQETTIEKLQSQIQTSREQVQKYQKDVQTYLNGLDLKATIQKSPLTPSPELTGRLNAIPAPAYHVGN